MLVALVAKCNGAISIIGGAIYSSADYVLIDNQRFETPATAFTFGYNELGGLWVKNSRETPPQFLNYFAPPKCFEVIGGIDVWVFRNTFDDGRRIDSFSAQADSMKIPEPSILCLTMLGLPLLWRRTPKVAHDDRKKTQR